MDAPRDASWRFINAAPIVGGQAALDQLFAETLIPFGIDRFDCVRLAANGEDEPKGVISGRGTADWNRYFREQGYLATDPCVRAYEQFNGAYTWSAARAHLPGAAKSPMWGDASAGGMNEGLIVPTAAGRPSMAIVRLMTPEPEFEPGVLPLLQSISAVYAISTQSFSAKPRRPEAPSPADTGLTEREIECLYWAARGKTNPEIGVILAISRHTVNTHIEHAKTKLGVATRVQAAAVAHRLGLLSIA